MGLQRLAGNRAVVHHLGSLSQVQVPVAQREIGDDVDEGTEIKMWDPDAGKAGEVVVVTFVRLEGDEVLYHPAAEVSTKGSQAKKKANRGNQATKQKPRRVKSRYAFSYGTSNKEIEREVRAIGQQEEKGVGASKAVISYVMGLLKTNGEKQGLDVKPDARKVVDVLNGSDDFRDFVEDKTGLEELISGDQDYFVKKLVDAMRGESLAPVDSAPSKVGSSQPDWKSNKTIDLRNALVATLEGKQGAEKLAGGTTLAHKISRNRLGMMLTLLKKAQASKGTQLMWAFVGDVEKLTGRHGEEAIENWTANLELGPTTITAPPTQVRSSMAITREGWRRRELLNWRRPISLSSMHPIQTLWIGRSWLACWPGHRARMQRSAPTRSANPTTSPCRGSSSGKRTGRVCTSGTRRRPSPPHSVRPRRPPSKRARVPKTPRKR